VYRAGRPGILICAQDLDVYMMLIPIQDLDMCVGSVHVYRIFICV
jgi:hypothetical protein